MFKCVVWVQRLYCTMTEPDITQTDKESGRLQVFGIKGNILKRLSENRNVNEHFRMTKRGLAAFSNTVFQTVKSIHSLYYS